MSLQKELHLLRADARKKKIMKLLNYYLKLFLNTYEKR